MKQAERAHVWSLVHAERQALVDDLTVVTAEQWEAASGCEGWTVHDVVAHLVHNAKATTRGLIVDMVRARFDFDRQNQRGVDQEKGATPAETLDRLRAAVDQTSTPPVSLDSRLVEEVVHGEDVRRPLGLVRDYPTEAVSRAVAYQARTPVAMGGGRERAAALDLRDPTVDVLLQLSGRSADPPPISPTWPRV